MNIYKILMKAEDRDFVFYKTKSNSARSFVITVKKDKRKENIASVNNKTGAIEIFSNFFSQATINRLIKKIRSEYLPDN